MRVDRRRRAVILRRRYRFTQFGVVVAERQRLVAARLQFGQREVNRRCCQSRRSASLQPHQREPQRRKVFAQRHCRRFAGPPRPHIASPVIARPRKKVPVVKITAGARYRQPV